MTVLFKLQSDPNMRLCLFPNTATSQVRGEKAS